MLGCGKGGELAAVGEQNSTEEGGAELLQVCDDEDEDDDENKENDREMSKGLTNSVAHRLFIGGSTRPSLPTSSATGPLITRMPGPRM